MNKVRIVNGTYLIEVSVLQDNINAPASFDLSGKLPFVCERVFTIKADSGETVRGGHANSCDELIVALSGSVTAYVNNGSEVASIRLDADDKALWVCAGVFIELHEFTPQTVLLVFASRSYRETEHFDAPQRNLISDEKPSDRSTQNRNRERRR